MALIKYIIFLLAFLGVMFYFRVDINGGLQNVKSSLSVPIKAIISELFHGTTSLSFFNTVPSNSSSTSTSTATSTVNIATSTKNPVNNSNDSGTNLPPVTGEEQYSQSALTIYGIVNLTNKERAAAGKSDLTINEDLNKSAALKLEDMFTNQYFEHVSPAGLSVVDLAVKSGYQYIVVGENLALGGFKDDAAVVAAWMASPGHKANILDPRFKDIGVAVGKGMYKGRMTWLAVQHFGKPLSSCNGPEVSLKIKVDANKADLEKRQANLTLKKNQLDSYSGDQYVQKVNEYNALVNQYNLLLNELKFDIEQYNKSVNAFNICAGATS